MWEEREGVTPSPVRRISWSRWFWLMVLVVVVVVVVLVLPGGLHDGLCIGLPMLSSSPD